MTLRDRRRAPRPVLAPVPKRLEQANKRVSVFGGTSPLSAFVGSVGPIFARFRLFPRMLRQTRGRSASSHVPASAFVSSPTSQGPQAAPRESAARVPATRGATTAAVPVVGFGAATAADDHSPRSSDISEVDELPPSVAVGVPARVPRRMPSPSATSARRLALRPVSVASPHVAFMTPGQVDSTPPAAPLPVARSLSGVRRALAGASAARPLPPHASASAFAPAASGAPAVHESSAAGGSALPDVQAGAGSIAAVAALLQQLMAAQYAHHAAPIAGAPAPVHAVSAAALQFPRVPAAAFDHEPDGTLASMVSATSNVGTSFGLGALSVLCAEDRVKNPASRTSTLQGLRLAYAVATRSVVPLEFFVPLLTCFQQRFLPCFGQRLLMYMRSHGGGRRPITSAPVASTVSEMQTLGMAVALGFVGYNVAASTFASVLVPVPASAAELRSEGYEVGHGDALEASSQRRRVTPGPVASNSDCVSAVVLLAQVIHAALHALVDTLAGRPGLAPFQPLHELFTMLPALVSRLAPTHSTPGEVPRVVLELLRESAGVEIANVEYPMAADGAGAVFFFPSVLRRLPLGFEDHMQRLMDAVPGLRAPPGAAPVARRAAAGAGAADVAADASPRPLRAPKLYALIDPTARSYADLAAVPYKAEVAAGSLCIKFQVELCEGNCGLVHVTPAGVALLPRVKDLVIAARSSGAIGAVVASTGSARAVPAGPAADAALAAWVPIARRAGRRH